MLNYQRVYAFFLGLSFDIGYPGPSFHFLFGLAHILTWDMQAWSRGFMEFQHCKNHHLRTLDNTGIFLKNTVYLDHQLINHKSSIHQTPAFQKNFWEDCVSLGIIPRHPLNPPWRQPFKPSRSFNHPFHWPLDSKKTTSITKSRSSKIICVPCSCWRARRVP